MNKRGLALIQQNPIHTAIVGIERTHRECHQAGAVIERIVSNAGDAVADYDAGQAGTGIERRDPDAGDIVADYDVGQAAAVRERIVPNVDDAVRDCITSIFTPRTLDECGLALIEQDPIHTAIDRIERTHRECHQVDAVIERINCDAGNVVAEHDVGQARAVVEYIIPDSGDAVADYDAGQSGTGIECRDPDAGDIVGDYDVDQAAAVRERIVSNAGDAVADYDAGQSGTGIERRDPDAGDVVGDYDVGQAAAVRERKVPNVDDAVRDYITSIFTPRTLDEYGLALIEQDPIHAAINGIEYINRKGCQARATEIIDPDIGDAFANYDIGQAAAVIEHIGPHTGGVVVDRDASQAGAATERFPPDAGDAHGDCDVGQATIGERGASNAGDAVGDRDAVQAETVRECKGPDAGDAAGDCITSIFSRRTLDECGLALIEQDPIHTTIGGIECIHRECHHVVAAIEYIVRNTGDTVANHDVGQAAAGI